MMNERIKEIANDAGIHPSNFEPDADIKVPLEKFAELIVLECANLFHLTFTDERYQRRIDRTIKGHFGVEND